jgi:hypothetical protein
MPVPLDISGQSFGLLTAKHLDTKRSTPRERFWHCECKCGGSKSVRVSDLRAGKTKSCGCLIKKVSPRHGWKKAAVHREYQAKDIITWEGETLYSPRQAAKFLGRTHSLLRRWANLDPVRRRKKNGKLGKEFKGCPYLHGQALRTIPVRGAQNRPIHYFPLDALHEVKNAMCVQINTPDQEGLTYVGDALRRLGVSLRTLRDKLKKWNPQARPVKRHGRGSDGYARRRAYVPTEFVEWMEAGAGRELAPDTVTVPKAAQKLGVSEWMVRYYIKHKRLDVDRVDQIIETKGGKGKRPPLRYVRKGLGVTSTSLLRLKRELREPPAPANQEKTEHTASKPSDQEGTDPTSQKRRGRPKGRVPEVREREQDMLAAWDRGEFLSKSAAGEAYGFYRQDATRIINDHESRKCKK